MKNKLFVLPLALVLVSTVACTGPRHTNPTSLPPGEYKRTEKSVNEAGTETQKTTNTNVYYDADGNKRAVQETETSTDPKGLMNKSTSKTVKTYN